MNPTKGDLEKADIVYDSLTRDSNYTTCSGDENNIANIAQALAEARAEAVKECSAKNDLLETQIACATDLANTWAREFGVKECDNPYFGLFLRDLISRLWDKSAGYRIEIEKLKHSLTGEEGK